MSHVTCTRKCSSICPSDPTLLNCNKINIKKRHHDAPLSCSFSFSLGNQFWKRPRRKISQNIWQPSRSAHGTLCSPVKTPLFLPQELRGLVYYQPEESRATLSAQHASKEHHVVVHTLFVEPFNPIIGAQYIVLGEIEIDEGVGAMVRARVLNCVDGVNIALLQKAIGEQRSFFSERKCKQGAQPADAT